MATKAHAQGKLTEHVGPVRISAQMKAELEELAARNERGVHAEVRLAIRARLEQEGKK